MIELTSSERSVPESCRGRDDEEEMKERIFVCDSFIWERVIMHVYGYVYIAFVCTCKCRLGVKRERETETDKEKGRESE